MKSKKIVATVTLVACMAGFNPINNLVSPNVAFADINEDVKNAQNKYEEYGKMIDEVNGKIYSLSGSIESLVYSVAETEDKIISTENEICLNESKVESLKSNIAERERLKDVRIREMYKSNVVGGYMEVVFSAKSFSELISSINGISKIINIDKDIISGLEKDKTDLNNLINELEVKRKDLNSYKSKLNSEKEDLEIKKSEQEQLISSLEAEKSKFGEEVLSVLERQLVEYQLNLIASSNTSSELSSAVNQLELVKDNQLTSSAVIEEVNNAIENGNSKIEEIRQEELRQEELARATFIPSRGAGFEGSTGNNIVDYAYQFLGRPYVWGAVGPDVFDCSGLTSYVYRHAAGVEITRTTYTQINVGTPVSQSELQPGDLVFTYNNEHVGIYVGNGMYINATYPGSTVRVTPVTNFYAARRIL